MLASVGIDGRVRLWDLTCHVPKELASLPQLSAEFQSVCFAPNDDYVVACGTQQSTARIWRWDWKDGKVAEWGAYQGDNAGVPSAAFAPDGKRFAAGIGAFVIVWKVNGRTAGTGEILKGHTGRVRAITWSADCKKLISGGEARNLRTWGFGWLGTSQKLKWSSHTDTVTTLALTLDGRKLAVGGDKQIVLWDAEDPKEETAVRLNGNSHQVRLLQYLSDGNLLSVGHAGQVLIWDTAAATTISEFQMSERLASCVAVSADGRHIASGSTDGKISIFEFARTPAGATVGG